MKKWKKTKQHQIYNSKVLIPPPPKKNQTNRKKTNNNNNKTSKIKPQETKVVLRFLPAEYWEFWVKEGRSYVRKKILQQQGACEAKQKPWRSKNPKVEREEKGYQKGRERKGREAKGEKSKEETWRAKLEFKFFTCDKLWDCLCDSSPDLCWVGREVGSRYQSNQCCVR
jgi:hypothetical protein